VPTVSKKEKKIKNLDFFVILKVAEEKRRSKIGNSVTLKFINYGTGSSLGTCRVPYTPCGTV
jgi:hypothetical protein